MKKVIFDDFANIYDEDMAKQKHLDGDINLYLQYAKHIKSPILDIGCGTGRVAVPLIRAGYQVDGIDISKKMILKFKNKLTKNELSKNFIYIDNALNWKNVKKYNMIIMPDDVLLHFLSPEQQLKILERCYLFLKEKGILIIDVFRQHYENLFRYESTTFTNSSGRIRKIYSDYETQINKIEYTYLDGKVRNNFVRWISESELRLMIKISGLKIIDIFGNYDKSEMKYSSPKMIFICQRD